MLHAAVIRMKRDTDAAADEIALLDHPRLRDRCQHLFHQLPHILGTRVTVDQQHELVAAQARDGVAVTDAGPEPRGHGFQQLVADVMPETVVDELETVEIDEGHGDPRPELLAVSRACCKRSWSSERLARPVSVS